MILFRKKEENVSGYNRQTHGWCFMGIFSSIEKVEQWIEGHYQENYFPQEDGSVLDSQGNTVRVAGETVWDFFDHKYFVEKEFADLTEGQMNTMAIQLGVTNNTGEAVSVFSVDSLEWPKAKEYVSENIPVTYADTTGIDEHIYALSDVCEKIDHNTPRQVLQLWVMASRANTSYLRFENL